MHGLKTTPYNLFWDDLTTQLKRWTAQGDRIVLMMNANEHILTGISRSKLTDYMKELDLEEISHRAWGAEEPKSRDR